MVFSSLFKGLRDNFFNIVFLFVEWYIVVKKNDSLFIFICKWFYFYFDCKWKILRIGKRS